MTALVNCPHCSTRVLPMAGRVCPACRKNVDSPADSEPKPERVVEAAYSLAAEQMRSGAAPAGVEKMLTERGLDGKVVATVVNRLERETARSNREAAQTNIFYGLVWCSGGIGVTMFTYQLAAGAGGGKYVLAWGAILYGAIRFLRGLSQLGNG